VAIPLTLCGGYMIFLWSQGQASFWLALMGCFVVLRTIGCVGQLRRYKAWRKEWDSVGTFGNQPIRKHRVIPALTVLALIVFLGTPLLPQGMVGPEIYTALARLWLVSAIFLATRVLTGICRRVLRHRKKNIETAKRDAEPVSLMLTTTLDSPSRETAVRNLPEYAARVLHQGHG
jgi:hypothetical protein